MPIEINPFCVAAFLAVLTRSQILIARVLGFLCQLHQLSFTQLHVWVIAPVLHCALEAPRSRRQVPETGIGCLTV